MIIKPLLVQVALLSERNTGWLDGTVCYVVEDSKYYQLVTGSFVEISEATFNKLYARIDDTKGDGDLTNTWSADKIFDQLALKLSDGTWTDYSATSTIVGFSSYSIKTIYYKRVGNLVFVSFYINGTSNSATTSFTLPYASASVQQITIPIAGYTSGISLPTAIAQLTNGTSTVTTNTDLTSGTWNTSGQKIIAGQFFYETS